MYKTRANGTRIISTEFTEPSKTQAEYAKDTDVNTIVSRYLKTGIDPFTRKNGSYIDETVIPTDFHSAMTQVTSATTQFNQLPAKLRRFFGDNPENLITFLEDPSNEEQAIKLGLINPSRKSEGIPEEKSPTTSKKEEPIKTNDDPTTNEEKAP